MHFYSSTSQPKGFFTVLQNQRINFKYELYSLSKGQSHSSFNTRNSILYTESISLDKKILSGEVEKRKLKFNGAGCALHNQNVNMRLLALNTSWFSIEHDVYSGTKLAVGGFFCIPSPVAYGLFSFIGAYCSCDKVIRDIKWICLQDFCFGWSWDCLGQADRNVLWEARVMWLGLKIVSTSRWLEPN